MSESLEHMMVRLGMKSDPDYVRKSGIELGVLRDPDWFAREARRHGYRMTSLDDLLQSYRRQLPSLGKDRGWETGRHPSAAIDPYGQDAKEEPDLRIEPYRYGMPLEGGFRLFGKENLASIHLDLGDGYSMDIHHHPRGGGAAFFSPAQGSLADPMNEPDKRFGIILPWNPPRRSDPTGHHGDSLMQT